MHFFFQAEYAPIRRRQPIENEVNAFLQYTETVDIFWWAKQAASWGNNSQLQGLQNSSVNQMTTMLILTPPFCVYIYVKYATKNDYYNVMYFLADIASKCISQFSHPLYLLKEKKKKKVWWSQLLNLFGILHTPGCILHLKNWSKKWNLHLTAFLPYIKEAAYKQQEKDIQQRNGKKKKKFLSWPLHKCCPKYHKRIVQVKKKKNTCLCDFVHVTVIFFTLIPAF